MHTKVMYENNRCPMGPVANGYIGFSVQYTVTNQGPTYTYFYTNDGYTGGKTFCRIINGQMFFGADWCYKHETEIKDMCEKFIQYKVYDFNEYFTRVFRDKALSKLI